MAAIIKITKTTTIKISNEFGLLYLSFSIQYSLIETKYPPGQGGYLFNKFKLKKLVKNGRQSTYSIIDYTIVFYTSKFTYAQQYDVFLPHHPMVTFLKTFLQRKNHPTVLKKVILKFPTIMELADFSTFVDLKKTLIDKENLTLAADLSEAEIELAKKAYNALVVTVSSKRHKP